MNPEPEIPRPRSRSRHLSAPTVLKVIPRPLQRIMLSFVSPLDSHPFTCTFEVATIFPRFTRPKNGPRFRTFANPAPSASWRYVAPEVFATAPCAAPAIEAATATATATAVYRRIYPSWTIALGDESFFMNL